MIKLINKILFYTKVIFLLIAFIITLYILLMRMDINNSSILSIIPLFIPLFGVLCVFVFSFFLNKGDNNLLFNIGCVLVLLTIIIIDYRTLFDNNIISITKINLNYFDGQTMRIKIILYLTIIGNIMLIIKEKKDFKKIHS